ncbi:hypothetical protein [Kribbella sp. NPDC051718]|uniref:hypothetical protein n=1 Tax=Kribbella sp. NPDC051718 TaxID=3155168 RepID=UPI00341D2CF4
MGRQRDWFPAFYTRSSGLRIPHRVDDEQTVCTASTTAGITGPPSPPTSWPRSSNESSQRHQARDTWLTSQRVSGRS